MQPHPVLEILPQFDIVSFDVFDTLLLRPFTKPTDLFEKLERDFGAKGFAKARTRAERNAHRKASASGRIEATFDEIYALIPQWGAMKERELAAEESCWTANPEMLDVWRAAKCSGKKILVTTDMYLPRSIIERALRDRGFDGWNGFYLSNELQTQKATGSTYDRILMDFPVAPDRILHLGDHPVSDIARANEKGIVAFHSPRVFDRFLEECPFVRKFLGKTPSLERRLFVGALAVGWHAYKYDHPDWTYWNRIGFLFAGTLGYAYMRFVGERANELGLDHLLFVARDGYILEKIFARLHPEIATNYFHASRVSALLATLDFGHLPKDIRQRREFLADYLAKKEHVILPENDLLRFLESGRLPATADNAIRMASERERKNVTDYFSAFEIDGNRTALVDGTSSNFTVQNLLASIYGPRFRSFYLHTMRPTVDADTFFPTTSSAMRFQSFSEILFGAPTPPVRSIENGEPVFESSLHFFERRKMAICPEIEAGALACADGLRRTNASVEPRLWYDWFSAFSDNVSHEDEMSFSLVRNATGVTHSDYLPVLTQPLYRKSFRILGVTILSVSMEQTMSGDRCAFRLFGWIPLSSIGWNRWCKFRSFAKTFLGISRKQG